MKIIDDMRIKRNKKRRNRMYGAKSPRKKIPWWIWLIVVVILVVAVGLGVFLNVRHQKAVAKEQKLKIELQDKKKKSSDSSSNSTSSKDAVEEYEKKATEIVDRMSLEEKALGVLVTSPEDFTGIKVAVAAGDQSKQVLNQYAIGGLTYQEQNFENISQLQLMLTNTKVYSKYPIFVCTNEALQKAASSSGKTTLQMGFNVDRTDGWKYLKSDGSEVIMTATVKVAECAGKDAVSMLKDGADMIVLTDGGFETVYKEIVAAVQDGTLDEAKLTKSVERMMEIKVQ